MHELYLQKYEAEEYAKKEDRKFHVTYEYYREYFNTHFNLGFGVPSSDTFVEHVMQLTYKYKISSQPRINTDFKKRRSLIYVHLYNFTHEIHTCTEMAKQSTNMACLSFDFEQISHCHIYLLMKSFTCVNFGFMSSAYMILLLERVTCWPETTAHRGSNEVASVLFHYLKKY